MEKRTKHLTAKLFCLFLLSAVLSACQSDLYDHCEFEEVETKSFDVTDARNWFEAHAHRIRPNEVLTRGADGSEEVVTQSPVFNWNIAEMSNNPEWEVVELPWEYENVVQIFALAEVWQHALATNTVPKNVIRLVVMQHQTTGATYGFKMKIAPTLDYLLSHGGNLSDNKLLDRDSRLSGVVLFYTLSGLFVNGWAYQNGEIVAEVVSKREATVEDMNAPTTRSGIPGRCPETGFIIIWDDLMENLHTDGGGMKMAPPPSLSDLFPSWQPQLPSSPSLTVHPHSPPLLPHIPSAPQPSVPSPSLGWGAGTVTGGMGADWFSSVPMPSGGGGGGGSGAGSGASIGMPVTEMLHADDRFPTASRIFNFRNPADMQTVEGMLNEIMRDCMGRALVNGLTNGWGSERLNFQFQPGRSSELDAGTNTVTLGRDFPGNVHLFHELFHVFQRQENRDRHTVASWNALAMNREIEVWLADYIFAARGDAGGNAETLEDMFYGTDFGLSVVALANYITPRGTIRAGQEHRLREALTDVTYPEFKAHSTYGSLPFTRPNQPASWTMFDNIRRLSVNC